MPLPCLESWGGGVRCDGGEGAPRQQQSNSASQELVAAGGHTRSVIPDTVGGALLTQHPESREESADLVTPGRAPPVPLPRPSRAPLID